MKFLLDENLSPRLVPRLVSLIGALSHVREVGLQRADDKIIWEWAKANGYTLVTADSNFVAMSKRHGWPPKVIHIEQCDCRFRVIENLLRRNAVRISELDKDDAVGIFTLRLPLE